jgi:hypothetical protein
MNGLLWIKALNQIPVNAELTPGDSGRSGVEFCTFKLDSLGSKVQGYLAKPAKEGKFPAVVIFQSAGVYASHIKAVSLVAMGFLDTTAPPVGVWTAFNQIKGGPHDRFRPQQPRHPPAAASLHHLLRSMAMALKAACQAKNTLWLGGVFSHFKKALPKGLERVY